MILIGLGSNLPFLESSSQSVVIQASNAVSSFGTGSKLSPLYKSPAWPDPTNPEYVNAVLCIEASDLAPEELLSALMAVEMSFGRHRDYVTNPELRYAPRTLDLDLLAYDDRVLEINDGISLTIPHPRLQERDFVLLPMFDVAPDWRHPTLQKSCAEMVDELRSKIGGAFTATKLELD